MEWFPQEKSIITDYEPEFIEAIFGIEITPWVTYVYKKPIYYMKKFELIRLVSQPNSNLNELTYK